MAVLTSTSPARRHIIGDLCVRHYSLTGSGTTGDTFIPSAQGDIEHVSVTPTTSASIGVTISGNTLTFVVTGAWTADVMIFSRIG